MGEYPIHVIAVVLVDLTICTRKLHDSRTEALANGSVGRGHPVLTCCEQLWKLFLDANARTPALSNERAFECRQPFFWTEAHLVQGTLVAVDERLRTLPLLTILRVHTVPRLKDATVLTFLDRPISHHALKATSQVVVVSFERALLNL